MSNSSRLRRGCAGPCGAALLKAMAPVLNRDWRPVIVRI
jgi:hypothetical protein